MNKRAVLDLIAEMKAKAISPAERNYYDGMAIGILTQEIEPLRMADPMMAQNLDHWIGRNWLGRSARPVILCPASAAAKQ